MASAPLTSSTTSASPTAAPTLFASDPSTANFQVSRAAFLKSCPSIGGICASSFVFDDAKRLLLVQRAPHDSSPLRWEVPGGTVDATDETVLHGLVRELWEESGLRARFVSRLVGNYSFKTRRALPVTRYFFFVDVEGYDVRLDPNEHVAFLWVTEDEARASKCGDVDIVYTTKDQEGMILESFRIKRDPVAA
ncbi:NUDIX hydrolase domain-like protein [Xylaria intraflava]|nr:NUDIX hydrolase domain-like protein [Xylaria intraflava]